ncbi:MAG: DUF3955 domain-containing protein [Cohaesibacter sp.]|nr:DUF3955 domain-containing protein [Cohaesibacter sp.]
MSNQPIPTKSLLFAALALIGIALLIAFNLIGGEVGEDGLLSEPFFLVPLGYLCLIIGVAGAAISWFKGRRTK